MLETSDTGTAASTSFRICQTKFISVSLSSTVLYRECANEGVEQLADCSRQQKKPAMLLSFDISAAFDSLDQNRLLQRAAELFGLTGRVNDWLKSYLAGRSTYVAEGNRPSATS
jgi:hypothetical protein